MYVRKFSARIRIRRINYRGTHTNEQWSTAKDGPTTLPRLVLLDPSINAVCNLEIVLLHEKHVPVAMYALLA